MLCLKSTTPIYSFHVLNEPAERVLRVRIGSLTVVTPVGKKQFLLNKMGCVKMNSKNHN